MHSRNFKGNFFQRFGNNEIQHKLSLLIFSGVESHLIAFGEQNLYMNESSVLSLEDEILLDL